MNFSDDLKKTALRLHFDKGWVPDDVAKLLGFSTRSFYCWKERFLSLGELDLPPHPNRGHPRLLDPPVTRDLMDLVKNLPHALGPKHPVHRRTKPEEKLAHSRIPLQRLSLQTA